VLWEPLGRERRRVGAVSTTGRAAQAPIVVRFAGSLVAAPSVSPLDCGLRLPPSCC